jgi:hypothetical protein
MTLLTNKFSFVKTGVFLLLPFFLPAAVSAQLNNVPANIHNLNGVFISGISSVIALMGLASLGMLLFGGYGYISAGADKNATSKAWQTITLSLAGLIITLSAWIILKLMGGFLGVDLTTFDICITPGCE